VPQIETDGSTVFALAFSDDPSLASAYCPLLIQLSYADGSFINVHYLPIFQSSPSRITGFERFNGMLYLSGYSSDFKLASFPYSVGFLYQFDPAATDQADFVQEPVSSSILEAYTGPPLSTSPTISNSLSDQGVPWFFSASSTAIVNSPLETQIWTPSVDLLASPPISTPYVAGDPATSFNLRPQLKQGLTICTDDVYEY